MPMLARPKIVFSVKTRTKETGRLKITIQWLPSAECLHARYFGAIVFIGLRQLNSNCRSEVWRLATALTLTNPMTLWW